jgi:2-polyprenyl-3-methyl-5-hydroxy-6-metoxy-1,4-benzoquinol methylase
MRCFTDPFRRTDAYPPAVRGLRLNDKQRALDHYARIADGYHERVEQGPVLGALRRRERGVVLDLAQLAPGLSLADVGCGNGFYALEAKRRGARVCAIDAVPEMLAGLAGSVDDVRLRDVEQLGCIGTFDRVVCAGVLDFVVDPDLALANICGLVARNGRLVLLAPCVGPAGSLYRAEKLLLGFRVNLFTRAWFVARAATHGLRLVQVRRPLPWNIAIAAVRP